MYFGEKDFYRVATEECEAVVECGGLVKGQHTYERDAEINKCVSKIDGSVFSEEAFEGLDDDVENRET